MSKVDVVALILIAIEKRDWVGGGRIMSQVVARELPAKRGWGF